MQGKACRDTAKLILRKIYKKSNSEKKEFEGKGGRQVWDEYIYIRKKARCQMLGKKEKNYQGMLLCGCGFLSSVL